MSEPSLPTSTIRRFSSRRRRLDRSFLYARLDGAQRYDRIAGYFSSSLLEVVGEELESVAGPIRIVCNSDLHPQDVLTAWHRYFERDWVESQLLEAAIFRLVQIDPTVLAAFMTGSWSDLPGSDFSGYFGLGYLVARILRAESTLSSALSEEEAEAIVAEYGYYP